MSAFVCLIKQAAETNGEQPALLCGEKVISYGQYDKLVTTYANNLRQQNIGQNDRVGIAGRNCLEYPIVLFALMRLGAVACTVNRFLPRSGVIDQLQRINCHHLIDFDNAMPDLPPAILKIDGPNIDKLLSGPTSTTVFDFPQLDHSATIMFTSSSTGDAKGVVHTYGNHFYSALGSNENIKLAPKDCWLASLPMYHVGGLSILFRCAIAGASVRFMTADASIEQTMSSYPVTHLSLVTAQLKRLLDCEPKLSDSNLKAVLIGGGSLPSGLTKRALEARLPLHTTYGMTETSSQLTCTPPGSSCETAGRLLLHRELKIADDSEIIVGGKTLFKQYVNQPPIGEWFATGDIGHLDEQGNLFVVGRKDNMFISGGENIHPESIEQALSGLPEIDDAIVVPVENAEFGYRPVVFIKWVPGKNQDVKELHAQLINRLPKYQIPIKFFDFPIVGEATSLKPNRVALAQLAAELSKSELS